MADKTPDELAAEVREQEAKDAEQPPVEPGRTPNPTDAATEEPAPKVTDTKRKP